MKNWPFASGSCPSLFRERCLRAWCSVRQTESAAEPNAKKHFAQLAPLFTPGSPSLRRTIRTSIRWGASLDLGLRRSQMRGLLGEWSLKCMYRCKVIACCRYGLASASPLTRNVLREVFLRAALRPAVGPANQGYF